LKIPTSSPKGPAVSPADETAIAGGARLIGAGRLVAFPTETVYGIACRVDEESLEKLSNIKGRNPDKYYTLHIGSKWDVEKYIPSIGIRGRKLISNAWPGPLTIVFEIDKAGLNKQQECIEKGVFENLYRDNSIGIRCPDNEIASILLKQCCYPVVAPSANLTGQEPAVDGKGVLEAFDGEIEMVLDSGPCKYKKSSTVAKIGVKGIEILRVGAYSEEELGNLSKVNVLFVCTGNTCRSPMAEGMFRQYCAEKMGCKVDQLDKKGYKIQSAGTMGLSGMPASAESVSACAGKGIDIKAHRSSALSQQLIGESDVIYTMSRSHRDRIITLEPGAADKCMLLADEEVPDPIGQSQEVYDKCAATIEKAVRKRIGEII